MYAGNDLAIDMVMYGSDYLLGLSTFAPDAFALRDHHWASGDERFFELNDVLQYLGAFGNRFAALPMEGRDAGRDGSPYYTPHIQRPACYPPSEGHLPPEDPLVGVARILGTTRDANPHFLFMFFESTHAPQVVAPDAIVIPDYLRHFDYVGTDIAANIEGIRNRYLNTAYHLDSQIGRLLDALQRTGHLDDTIVVITGDHREAFLEDGRWGHNSAFDDAQLHVPLIVSLPGESPRLYTHVTCHEDIVATLLPRLGVRNAPVTSTTGLSLTEAQPGRTVVATDWSRLGLLADDYRAVLPYRAAGIGRSSIRYLTHRSVADAKMARDMADVLALVSRFVRH